MLPRQDFKFLCFIPDIVADCFLNGLVGLKPENIPGWFNHQKFFCRLKFELSEVNKNISDHSNYKRSIKQDQTLCWGSECRLFCRIRNP
jgi:hypothetical protein